MRILITDDQLVCRTFLKEILATYGTCDEATTGVEAIASFQEAVEAGSPYSLVTMDVEMPQVGGHEAVTRIRQIEKKLGTPPTPIIMVTSRNEASVVVEAIRAGCNGYLIKPFAEDRVRKELFNLGFASGIPGN